MGGEQSKPEAKKDDAAPAPGPAAAEPKKDTPGATSVPVEKPASADAPAKNGEAPERKCEQADILVVSGAGEARLNGTYVPDPGATQKRNFSRPYRQEGGQGGTIEYHSTSIGGNWIIKERYGGSSYYISRQSTSSSPPPAGWIKVKGAAPAPSVSPGVGAGPSVPVVVGEPLGEEPSALMGTPVGEAPEGAREQARPHARPHRRRYLRSESARDPRRHRNRSPSPLRSRRRTTR